MNTKTGEEAHRLKAEYPAEKALESLGSRARPLTLNSEPIYYEKALNAMKEPFGSDKLNDEINLGWWHGYWRQVIDANLCAQAYRCTPVNRGTGLFSKRGGPHRRKL